MHMLAFAAPGITLRPDPEQALYQGSVAGDFRFNFGSAEPGELVDGCAITAWDPVRVGVDGHLDARMPQLFLHIDWRFALH